MKNFDEETLLRKICPAKYNKEMLSYEIEFLKLYARNRKDELRELEIHLKNSYYSGILIAEGNNAINGLAHSPVKKINILAGKNKNYFFKLYLSNEANCLLGFFLINRNQKSKNDD